MKSMTGYGRGQISGQGYDVSVELASVNRKTLDISVALPKEWTSLERLVTERVRSDLSRGAVKVTVQIVSTESAGDLQIDDMQVHRTLDKLGELARARGIRVPMDYDTLLRVVLLHREEGGLSTHAEEVVIPLVQSALEQAVVAFLTMREREGAALQKDLLERNEALLDMVFGIRKNAKGTVETYRDALLARLKSLGINLDFSDERLLKELAFFADKVDVAEELTRLESHLDQFKTTINASRSNEEPIGRKLEFLIQEINREFNTIGSKANNIEVTRFVLDAKNEIERQREQVQNVE